MAKKIKRNENDLSTWNVRQLRARAISLHASIYQLECFSSHDMVELMAVEAELERRGYECNESKVLSIQKAS